MFSRPGDLALLRRHRDDGALAASGTGQGHRGVRSHRMSPCGQQHRAAIFAP